MSDELKREISEKLHLWLSAAQNLPYEDGDTCEDCLLHASQLLPLFDSIAAKAFEMAAQEINDEIYMRENNKDRAGNLLYEDYMRPLDEIAAAIRAKSPASARRQLQLDLLRARLEERNKFALEINRSGGSIYGLDIENKDHLAELESEIAALE